MSNKQNSVHKSEETRTIAILVGLLAAGVALIYFGRAELLYQGSWLTGGFGAIGVTLGGADTETARSVMEAAQQPKPPLIERILFYLGIIAILLNAVAIQTGFLIGGTSGDE